MRTLIIDDDPVNSKLLQEVLAGFGEFQTINSGNEAITAFKKALKDGEPFELITLDIALPDSDGTEVLFEIRDIEEEWGLDEEERSVIMMVTAISDKNSITSAFSAGCDDYIVKPFDKKTIIKRLKKAKLKNQVYGTDTIDTTDTTHVNPIELVIDRFNKGKTELPSLPQISVQLNEMAKKGLDFKEIANLLKQDMSITAKIIRISNSTYYGAVTKTKTVEQAISRLGLSVTKQYVDAISNQNFFTTASKKYSKATEKLWAHSLCCAVTSEIVAKVLKLDLKGDAFTMGLMHDIGKMVLLQIAADLEARGKFQEEVDQEELFESIDSHHNTFGAKTLKKWNFADEYVQIALYHDDLGGKHPLPKDLQVVHFANLFAKTMANDHLDQTEIKLEDAESTRLLEITPDMIDEIREQVDKQMTVYG